MFGNSLQSLIANRVSRQTTMLTPTGIHFQSYANLRLVQQPQNTFIFDELNTTTAPGIVQNCEFYIRQKYAVKARDFLQSSRVNQRFKIIATYATSSAPGNDFAMVDDQEFIAILESPNFPLYIFTYDVTYIQYVHVDPTATNVDPIDRSVSCRSHAQFVARQFADEGRICTHQFSSQEELFERLIQHQELANVQYTSQSGVS